MENHDLHTKFRAVMHGLRAQRHRGHGGPEDPTRGQGRILAALKLQDGLSTKDLAYVLGLRVASLNELVAKLEKSGFVTREPSEQDKRVTLIRLTEQGRASEQETEEFDAFSVLTDEEREQLGAYLDRIIEHLGEQAGEGDDEFERWAEQARARMGDERFDRWMEKFRDRFGAVPGQFPGRGFGGGRPGGFGGRGPRGGRRDGFGGRPDGGRPDGFGEREGFGGRGGFAAGGPEAFGGQPGVGRTAGFGEGREGFGERGPQGFGGGPRGGRGGHPDGFGGDHRGDRRDGFGGGRGGFAAGGPEGFGARPEGRRGEGFDGDQREGDADRA